MARIVVHDFQRAVLHQSGAAARVLAPGRHRYRRWRSTLAVVDLRPAALRVASQEVLTADGVSVRASVVVRYTVTDPVAWVLSSDSTTLPTAWLHLATQLALRDLTGGLSAEDLLTSRGQAGQTMAPAVREAGERIGATVESVDLRDLTFPGDLKRTFADVAVARQEAAAALERARGEAATLRSLANAARVLDGNPALRELRALLAVERTKGTVVLAAGGTEGVATRP